MKTLHTGLHVRDLDRSLAFYRALGFAELGRVTTPDDETLVMLNLPGDGDVVALELVASGAFEAGGALSHVALQVDDLDEVLAGLDGHGIAHGAPSYPGGVDGPATAFVHDPDGHRFELVQWPDGHPAEMTRADLG